MESQRRTTSSAAAPGGVTKRLRTRNKDRLDCLALVGNRSCLHDNLTYGALFRLVDELAAGLMDLGAQSGDHVGLVSENSDLWLIANLGIMSIGAVDVPRGGDAPPDEIRFCLEHAECSYALLETARHVEMVQPIRHLLKEVVVLKGDPPPGTISWEALMQRGRERLEREHDELDRAQEAVSGSHVCTIIYTSGTTGNPKGVRLSHDNLLHNIRVIPDVLPFDANGRFLSFLPSWHSFERTIEYIVLDHGMTLHYGSKRTLKEDFKRVRPTFVAGVPRVYEIFYRQIMDGVRSKTGLLGAILKGCLEGSRVLTATVRHARGQVVTPGGGVARRTLATQIGALFLAILLALPHLLARLLVYGKVREAFGGELQAAVSGGGPLAAHVDEFLTRAGIPLINGYGLTETSPVLTVRTLQRNVLGTIGTPLPETEIRIVDDAGRDIGRETKGVIQARGPQIMDGYHRNESATGSALVGEGWFDTGDTGMISAQGDLMISGRAKDTLVLTGGENVEPEPLENLVLMSPFIADAILIGHGRKSLGALVVPDFAPVRKHLGLDKATSNEEIASLPQVLDLLKREVRQAVSRDKGYRTFEQISRLAVLPVPFSCEDGTLTQSLKKRRTVIETRYSDLISGLYGAS